MDDLAGASPAAPESTWLRGDTVYVFGAVGENIVSKQCKYLRVNPETSTALLVVPSSIETLEVAWTDLGALRLTAAPRVRMLALREAPELEAIVGLLASSELD